MTTETVAVTNRRGTLPANGPNAEVNALPTTAAFNARGNLWRCARGAFGPVSGLRGQSGSPTRNRDVGGVRLAFLCVPTGAVTYVAGTQRALELRTATTPRWVPTRGQRGRRGFDSRRGFAVTDHAHDSSRGKRMHRRD